jgi:serine protease Do
MAQPGSGVTLGLLRDGRRRDIAVQVAPMDEAAQRGVEAVQTIGLVVRTLLPEEARRLHLTQAVQVISVEPGSLAALAGIGPSTLILEVNRKPVGTPADFSAALGESAGGVLLRIAENGYSRYVTLRWR